jgi:hypothetical protein
MTELERLLFAYETDVRIPDVSGMEHLDMLLTRSRLEEARKELNAEQRDRLATADQVLARDSDRFYDAIKQIADLELWRNHEKAPASQWWWYLDVLAYARPSLRLETVEVFG